MCTQCEQAAAAELERIVENQGIALLFVVLGLVSLTWLLIRKGVLSPADLVS